MEEWDADQDDLLVGDRVGRGLMTFEDGIALGARVNALARMHPDFRVAVEAFFKT